MGSIFDDIFKPSGALPLASLFSQNSNFKAAQAPHPAAKHAIDVKQQILADSAPADTQISGKKSKGTKKRKHSTLEVEEAALPVSKPAQEPAVKKSGKRDKAPSSAQKPQTLLKEQLQLPNTEPSKSKDPKRKDKADVQVKAPEPSATTTADERPRKQKRVAKTPDSVAGAAQDAAGSTPIGNSSSETTQVAGQQDDTHIPADEQEALQKLTPEQQAERLRRTVFVGNLPAGMQRKAIRNEFAKYGGIESIRMRSVPVKLDAKMSRRAAITTGNISKERGTSHAYIVFQQEDSAVAALASNMHVLGNLHIRVDRAGQSAHGSAGGNVVYERNRTVFVGNLPFDVEDEELIVLFNESCTKLGIPNPVDAVRVVRDSASQLGKGFGFVQFSSQQAARAALGCDGQLLRKRPIRVTKAMKVSANLKQLGQKPKQQKDDRGSSIAGGAKPVTDTGVKQPRPSNKAVAALQRKPEPAENWQGFKTKGAKKTTAGAAVKSVAAGQRPVAGKRKAPEKRASVAARKQKSKPKPTK